MNLRTAFSLVLGGVAAIVAGLAILSPAYAAVALIVAGVAGIVAGFLAPIYREAAE